ncbi:MAG: MoaD/ThiS family protein [Candidatus Poribacteria bacterium]
MMNIQIKLFASLAKFLPEGAKGKRALLSVPEEITIRGVLGQLSIPAKMAQLIMVNGVRRGLDYVLQEGDLLSIFPPIAGG